MTGMMDRVGFADPAAAKEHARARNALFEAARAKQLQLKKADEDQLIKFISASIFQKISNSAEMYREQEIILLRSGASGKLNGSEHEGDGIFLLKPDQAEEAGNTDFQRSYSRIQMLDLLLGIVAHCESSLTADGPSNIASDDTAHRSNGGGQ